MKAQEPQLPPDGQPMPTPKPDPRIPDEWPPKSPRP